MKRKLKIKNVCVYILMLSLFLMMPAKASLADEEDVFTTVDAIANSTNGNVQKDVGNVNITDDEHFPGVALGIYATATDGKTATINTKDVNVNASSIMQHGIEATAGLVTGESSGKVFITTQSVTSKGDGIIVDSFGEGSELSVTTRGPVRTCVNSDKDDCHGIYAYAANSGKLDITVSGSVHGAFIGMGIRPSGEAVESNGIINVVTYGDVIANSDLGTGLLFDGSSNKCNVIITGTIVGGKYGVVTSSLEPYKTDTGDNNLIVWAISAPNGNLVMKETNENQGQIEADDDFAQKINYIIGFTEDVMPRKPDGSELDIKNEYYVAKEGDRIIVDSANDGAIIEKAFNNGEEITTKDELGRFYVDVKRGGGIFLTVEYQKQENPLTLKGKTIKVQAKDLAKNRLTRLFSKAVNVKDAKGELSFKKTKGTKKITVNKRTGKITIKKGLKKGRYKITVDVTASGDDMYNPTTKEVTFTIRVR